MAEHKVVNADQLDADLTSVADSIRTKAGTSDKLAFPAGMKEAVDNLSTFVPPSSMALDPDEVYRTTRPKDWLPMPTPGDDEVYLLNLIPEGVDGAFTALIRCTGTCTVEFGNLVDGVFVAKETVTPTNGTRFYKTVLWDDYGDTTSDGYRQYLVRIKGACTGVTLNPDNNTTYAHGVPMLVDVISGMVTDLMFSINDTVRYCCDSLRYVRIVGNGNLVYGGTLFRGCERLMSVSLANKCTTIKYANYMFNRCRSLIAVSENLFASPVPCNYIFGSAVFRALPRIKITATNAQGAFEACNSMQILEGNYFDTSRCTTLRDLFYNTNVRIIKDLNISSATDITSAIFNSHICQITFAGETTPGGFSIDLTNSILSHKALVNMINSLPTALSPATITITNNPGASALTDEEIAVATARNWTVTI